VIQGQPVENLDELPFPERSLFDLENVLNVWYIPIPYRYVGVLASRVAF